MSESRSQQPTGLDRAEARLRLERDGRNDLEPPRRRTAWRIVLEVAREPMFQLLLAAGIVYLLLGDRVAADAAPLQAHDLQPDESLLTGESVPVSESVSPREPAPGVPSARPGAPGLPCVYAGTLQVGGQGLARVVATGTRSEIGRIGMRLGGIASPATPLNVQTRRLVRLFSFIGVGPSLVVVVVPFGMSRHGWLGGVLAGITLAMSMLPEEFVLILTVFMAMGAWRLSQQRVMAWRSATIETLGAATVLCSDKTGTLTRNHRVVAEIAA